MVTAVTNIGKCSRTIMIILLKYVATNRVRSEVIGSTITVNLKMIPTLKAKMNKMPTPKVLFMCQGFGGERANWRRLKKWTRNTRPTFFIIVLPPRLDVHVKNS